MLTFANYSFFRPPPSTQPKKKKTMNFFLFLFLSDFFALVYLSYYCKFGHRQLNFLQIYLFHLPLFKKKKSKTRLSASTPFIFFSSFILLIALYCLFFGDFCAFKITIHIYIYMYTNPSIVLVLYVHTLPLYKIQKRKKK